MNDADSFYAADPNGYFVGELNGQVVGSISAVAYDDSYGFMGFYIVLSDLRGQGYGMRLWDAAIGYMGNRMIGADGVPAMLPKYETKGFRIAYRNVRFAGPGGGREPVGLNRLEDVAFEELAAYDRAHVPAPRTAFLDLWVRQPGSFTRIAMEGGRIVGYGMARPSRNAFRIGPLFADDADIAETLFAAFRAYVGDRTLLFDVPEPNVAAVSMAKECGMEAAFETSRIYKNGVPELPLEQIFGVTTFELG
jgi:GNAT superfamily N-acetyltransferase